MTAPAAKRARLEEDDTTLQDGSKPIQLQRRRVWRGEFLKSPAGWVSCAH